MGQYMNDWTRAAYMGIVLSLVFATVDAASTYVLKGQTIRQKMTDWAASRRNA